MYEIGDRVTVESENIRIPAGTRCIVENIATNEYYIRNRESQYCCWCKEEDISLDTPDMDQPLTAETMNLDGVINLASALIKSTKKDYISLAKARFQTTGKWQHFKERNATMEFVRQDPYNIFYITGNRITADDIFDAWDEEMLKAITKNDWVEVITANTGLMKGAAGWVAEVKNDDSGDRIFYVHTSAGNKAWCKVDDLELIPRPRHKDMPKSSKKKKKSDLVFLTDPLIGGRSKMERFLGKGYNVPDGYMGFIPEKNKYQLFASEQDYKEQVIFPQIESEDEEEVDN